MPNPQPESASVSSIAKARNFDCVLSRSGEDAVWIGVSGELDVATVPQLERALYEGLATAQLVVVDLLALTFIDSAGLHVIIDADDRARCNDRRLVLVRGPAQVERLFQLVGVAGQLEIFDLGAPA